MTVPAGTEVRVVGKHGGLDIESNPCISCGVSVRVRKVHYLHVEEIKQ